MSKVSFLIKREFVVLSPLSPKSSKNCSIFKAQLLNTPFPSTRRIGRFNLLLRHPFLKSIMNNSILGNVSTFVEWTKKLSNPF